MKIILHQNPQRSLFERLRPAVLSLLLAMSTGCVTVYQPLVGLQQPVAVDPQLPNLEGLRLAVRCFPGEKFNVASADLLCRRLESMFRPQGAEVTLVVPRPGASTSVDDEEAERPDLVIDVKSRLLHEDAPTALYALSWLTLTLSPAYTEQSFAQDVTIRDRDGFLLASETFQARFIEYFGFGIWAVNGVLDYAVRAEQDRLTGDVARQDFSRDFYGQLSQLAFNARVRSQVLRGFDRSSEKAPSRAKREE